MILIESYTRTDDLDCQPIGFVCLFVFNFIYSVDSLLQIHAIHNVLLVDTSIGADERQAYEAELNKMEMKYLEKYLNNVKNHQIEQCKWEEKIDVIYTKFEKNEYQWWINALKYEERDSEHLLRKIQTEIKTSYGFENLQ